MVFVVCQVTLMCWGGSSEDVSGGELVVVFVGGRLAVCCFCVQWRKDWRKFLVEEEHWLGNRDPITPCLPLNYRETCPLWELHTSGVGFELPHDKKIFSSQVLPSSSCVSQAMRLGLQWTRLHLLRSTSPPAPAPFDEYFIEQKRQPSSCSPVLFSDSVRALGTYHLQRWSCRCASEESGERIALGGSGVRTHPSHTQYHSLLEFKESRAST